MKLYERIKRRREDLGMSQETLANKLGYTDRSSIAKIESGLNDLTQSKIEAFAKALDTTPAYLMGWVEIPNTLHLTDHETKLIKAYREKPEMQSSVDKLLDINKDDKLKSLSMKELLEANRLEDAPRYGVAAAATGNNEKFLVSKENEIEAKKILDDIHNQKLD